MKISFAPVLALLAIWLLIVTRRSDLCLRGVALFSAACLCLGGFWYLRNWLVLGNPLSPAEVGPFWGPFDSESQWRTTLAPWLWGEYASLQNWKTVILGYGNQNGLLILFPAIGIALQAFASLRRQSRSSQETRRLILAAALLLIAFFPFTPFYGTVNNPDASIGVRPRFVIGIFALGAVLLAPHLRGPRRSLVAFACILSALNLPWLVVGAVLWGVASGVRGLWIAVHRKRDQGTRRLSIPGYKLVSAAVVFCWLLLAVAEPWIAHRTNRSLYSYVYHGVHFGDAWRRVNKLPPGSRIAASGFRANFILGIYGRKLQHEPVVLYENGSAVDQRFYELWNRFRRGKRWWERWYPDPVPTLEHQTSDRCMKRNQK